MHVCVNSSDNGIPPEEYGALQKLGTNLRIFWEFTWCVPSLLALCVAGCNCCAISSRTCHTYLLAISPSLSPSLSRSHARNLHANLSLKTLYPWQMMKQMIKRRWWKDEDGGALWSHCKMPFCKITFCISPFFIIFLWLYDVYMTSASLSTPHRVWRGWGPFGQEYMSFRENWVNVLGKHNHHFRE